MAEYTGKDTKISPGKIFLALVLLSFMLLLMSVTVVSAVTITQEGNMTSARGWLFSQSTPFGIYYGFGTNEDNYPFSDIYYFDFLTKTNTVVKSQTSQPDINLSNPSGVKDIIIWADTSYSAIVGDKIFISSVYYHNTPPWEVTPPWDVNGLYVIDTKTNSFYLYDRLPFNFFADNLASPMTAVGNYLYFFSEAERRVYRYDTITKQSTALAALPSDIGYGGIVFPVGSKIYITTYKYWEENSIWVYDTLTDKFTYLATSPLIPSNNYRSNSVINGKLYFVGGEDPLKGWNPDFNSVGRIVEYDPSTNQFNVTGDLGYGLLGASTASVGGTIYVTGGEVHSEPEITDKITAIEIVPKDNATIIAEYICNYYPANACAEHFLTAKSYKNRGDYISYVAQKTNEFVSNSLITGKEKGEIMAAATKLAKAIKK